MFFTIKSRSNHIYSGSNFTTARLSCVYNCDNQSCLHIVILLRACGHSVAKCCDMMGIVGSSLKIAKFFTQHLWDVAWCCTRLARFVHWVLGQGVRTSSICNAQHVATRRNRVAKRAHHAAHSHIAIRSVEMLRSFGRGLSVDRRGSIRYGADSILQSAFTFCQFKPCDDKIFDSLSMCTA